MSYRRTGITPGTSRSRDPIDVITPLFVSVFLRGRLSVVILYSFVLRQAFPEYWQTATGSLGPTWAWVPTISKKTKKQKKRLLADDFRFLIDLPSALFLFWSQSF